MANLQDKIVKNALRLCKHWDISQAELARRMGISPQQLNPYMKGAVKIPLNAVEDMAAALEVGVEELLGVPPAPMAPPRKPTEGELAAEVVRRFGLDPKRKELAVLALTAEAELVNVMHNHFIGAVEGVVSSTPNHKKPISG